MQIGYERGIENLFETAQHYLRICAEATWVNIVVDERISHSFKLP
jgi:hypothetical protein